MKQLDTIDLLSCEEQGDLFVASLEKTSCSSSVFLRRYMNSSFACRMDRGYYLVESDSVQSIFDEIEDEFGASCYGKEKYGEEELYWMGYLYRYWCICHNKTSREVYRIIKPSELRLAYPGYCSLDPSTAIERILEAKKEITISSVDYGVELMRKLSNMPQFALHDETVRYQVNLKSKKIQ